MFQILCNSHVIRTGFDTEADAQLAISRDLRLLFPYETFEVWSLQ